MPCGILLGPVVCILFCNHVCEVTCSFRLWQRTCAKFSNKIEKLAMETCSIVPSLQQQSMICTGSFVRHISLKHQSKGRKDYGNSKLQK